MDILDFLIIWNCREQLRIKIAIFYDSIDFKESEVIFLKKKLK